MQNRNTILLPDKAHGHSKTHTTKLSLLRVFSFQSHTLRSGAVVLSDPGPPGSALLYLKGAPDVISRMVQPASVPPDFQQVTVTHMHSMHVAADSLCMLHVPAACPASDLLNQHTWRFVESATCSVCIQLLPSAFTALLYRLHIAATHTQPGVTAGFCLLMHCSACVQLYHVVR